MLSRTASSLYWLGRYAERADFTARLVEATIRLDSLSSRPAGEVAWGSALTVLDAQGAFGATGAPMRADAAGRYLTIDRSHPASVASCLDMARTNAKAVRTALTREAWTAINRGWLKLQERRGAIDVPEMLRLVEEVKIAAHSFEGAVHRMLRNQGTWFIRLGQLVERADNTARLIDVKYHILLPEGEPVGGVVDRDQWTTILQTVSAVTAYRWLYKGGLTPSNVIDLLLACSEHPRSLAAAAEETRDLLALLEARIGGEGEAGAMAGARAARMAGTRSGDVILGGLHEWLEAFIEENDALHAAVGRQFRFG